MRAYIVVAATALAFAIPTAAHAQDATPPEAEPVLAEMSEKLADPAFQAQAAAIAQVLIGSMLELPIGPLADAMDEATGGEGSEIDPDARVRDLAPGAEALPEQVAERLPEAMTAMSAMSEGVHAMLPALRDMAERMRGAIEQTRDAR